MESKRLKTILEKHQLWLNDFKKGMRTDLRRADLSGTDLRRADLSGTDLRRADLREADLREADLRRADLSGTDLRRADLSGTDLRRADLREADLREANLRRADLREADLREANLREANLRRADLREAEYSILSVFRINWGQLSAKMTLELMRHDAEFIGETAITIWATENGDCPYVNKERDFVFSENRKLWKPGKPKLRGKKLFETLAKEIGLRIEDE